MNITIIGAGYVGLSIGLLLSKKHKVTMLDVVKSKIDQINNKISPIDDSEIKQFFANEDINLLATIDKEKAYTNTELVIIATPTNYDEESKKFDTRTVTSVISDSLEYNKNHIIIIKSTIPIGFTRKMKTQFSYEKIIFSPEFLREGSSISDNLYPSRIIIGDETESGKLFAKIMSEVASNEEKDINILYMGAEESESVKLFSNSYLALRVAYFNEIDTYCEKNNLSTKSIIKGISLDKRIGSHYNNPSFGYGGYCLPKDTKQLMNNYGDIPNSIVNGIVESNYFRKNHIADSIIMKKPKVVGFYRLVMKEGSDNIRESAIQDIIIKIKKAGIESIIYEPIITSKTFLDIKVVQDINLFKSKSSIIVANRISLELDDVSDKVYSRDIFNKD